MPTELDPSLALTQLLMRITAHGDLETKGADLTNVEVDNNFILIYEALKSIFNSSEVPPYVGGSTYQTNELVVYDEVAYFSLDDDNTGHTPGAEGSELFWGLCSLGDFVNLVFGSARTFTRQQFASKKTQGLLRAGSYYLVTGFLYNENPATTILVQANSFSTINDRASIVNSEGASIVEVDFTDADSDEWFVTVERYGEIELNVSDPAVYVYGTKALIIPTAYVHKEKIVITGDDYDELTEYDEDAIVKDPATGKFWVSLADANTGEPLDDTASPQMWALADYTEDGEGRLLVEQIQNMSSTHQTSFEVADDEAVQVMATIPGAANYILLNSNADVVIEGYGVLVLDTCGVNIRRQRGGSLLN